MLGLAAAFAVVGSLVWLAATRLKRQLSLDEVKLARLQATMRRGELSLDLAEDGAVLARRASRPGLEEEFKKKIATLKKGNRR